jgi:hypothetical protein
LGVLDTPLGSFVSSYLELPDLHLVVQWNDIMASPEAASSLMDYPIMDLAAQTVQNGRKTFWLRMYSVSDALKARGFLRQRYSSNGVLLQSYYLPFLSTTTYRRRNPTLPLPSNPLERGESLVDTAWLHA